MLDKLKLSNNKEMYYLLANNYFQDIDADEIKNKKFEIKNKSISVLIDHEFIPTPCVQINLDLYLEGMEKLSGTYHLYIQEDMAFIDEFLFLH